MSIEADVVLSVLEVGFYCICCKIHVGEMLMLCLSVMGVLLIHHLNCLLVE